MKFYVVEITNDGEKLKAEVDGKVAEYGGVSINAFSTLEDAKASLHGKLATNMKSPLCATEQVFIVDSNNTIYKPEKENGKYVEYVEPQVEEPIEEVTE